MDIIPAIDLINGKCVRLTQGDYSKLTIYNEDPLEVAKQFEAIGIKRLHLVDLDGAKKGEVVNLKVLELIAKNTSLKIDFGGGVKSKDAVDHVLSAGANFVTIGSLAVKDPETFFSWITHYGADKIMLGADVNNEKIAISGWLHTTDIDVYDFINLNHAKGINNIFCTDISKDGMLLGPAIELYEKIMKKVPGLSIIASGGVSGIKDLEALKQIGCGGVIIGKAIYEGKINMNELKTYLC